jgi:probable F420-dependent oxidoreductase
MQLGAVLSQNEIGTDLGALRAYAQAAQDLGYDFLVVADHVVGADAADHPALDRTFPLENTMHEPLALCAYLAGVVPGLGLLPSVLILPQRQTVLVAKQAAAVDFLSGGRLRLGVGIGWHEVEFAALGVPFRDRARRFEEQLALLRRLWTERAVTFAGQYHEVPAAGLTPLPVQRPIPLWIGASSEAAIRRATRLADGFLPLRPLEGDWDATMARVRGWLAEAGRDPATFGIEGRLDAGSGTPADWQRTIDLWRGFGASHLSVGTGGLGGVDAHIQRLREVKALIDG